jgi:hypothetical protein
LTVDGLNNTDATGNDITGETRPYKIWFFFLTNTLEISLYIGRALVGAGFTNNHC